MFNLCNNLFVVDAVPNIETNYNEMNDGPCSGKRVVVTCSVVGSSLRWTVTDTSLNIIGSNTVTMIANEDNVCTFSFITTTTIRLEFYQTRTTQNRTHPSSSTIESQMRFPFEADGFVEVSCTDSSLRTSVKNIRTLGMCFFVCI